MAKHFNIRILGRVQGVSFRYYGKMEADKLGITGLIKNQPDGSLYIEAEGTSQELKKFVDWCKIGPPLARVTNIEMEEREAVGYTDFIIVR